jgi:hypothetical protein
MDYLPKRRTKKASSGYGRFLKDKNRENKRLRKSQKQQLSEEKLVLTQKEIVEITLKRLHTLGNQRFGASPFSEYFERWVANVEAVLGEFTANPEIGVDDQFVQETQEALDTIKRQLEDRKTTEVLITQETEALDKVQVQLKKVEQEYAVKAVTLKIHNRAETKRINAAIRQLKREQDAVIKMKTGFWHLTSKKKREQKEEKIDRMLHDRQTEFEMALLDFSAEQKDLKDTYESKREPLQKQIRNLQKTIGVTESDGSLEERWFACEALIDAVNSFMQRKAAANPK